MATQNFSRYFPEYEVLEELGRANARVLKARYRQTQEIVAIKHYNFNLDKKTLSRFQRESKIMKSVDHPNVVKIKDIQLDAELPYIAMEFIEGGDVRSLLKTYGTLDVATVVRLGLQMADALEAIHKLGIKHCDIKPDNIMYREMTSKELHFLLTDFGISKMRGVDKVSITGESSMTIEYASPEQFDAPDDLTASSDFYSLGVVLYECLTGIVPFPQGTLGIGSYSKIVESQEPPALQLPKDAFLPEQLRDVVHQLLVKDPKTRLTSISKLRKQLRLAFAEIEPDEIEINKIIVPESAIERQEEIQKAPFLTERWPINENKVSEQKKLRVKPNYNLILPKLPSWDFTRKRLLIGFLSIGILFLGLWVYQNSLLKPISSLFKQKLTAEEILKLKKDSLFRINKRKDSLYSYIGDYKEGLAIALKKGSIKYGFINEVGEVVIPFEYDYADSFTGRLARVGKNKKYGFIDKTGKIIIPFGSESFSEGLSRVWQNGRDSFIDETGKTKIILPQNYHAESFVEGLAKVWEYPGGLDYTDTWAEGTQKLDLKKKCGFIDKTGKVVIPLEFDSADSFSEGLARVRKNKKHGFIDKTGKIIIPLEYDYADSFMGGIAKILYKNLKRVYINKLGQIVTTTVYIWSKPMKEGLILVEKDTINNSRYGFIDSTGKAVIPLEYDFADSFSEGLARVGRYEYRDLKYEFSRYGFIDKTGKIVIPLEYDVVDSFTEGLARVKKGSKEGFIDKMGEVVIPLISDYDYNGVHPFAEGLARVEKDNKFGFIDKTGKIVIPCRFEDAKDFNKGIAMVREDAKSEYQYVDRNGKIYLKKKEIKRK